MTDSAKPRSLAHLFKICGPGILMAGAAVGVSHLVQSTRAGADFGFQLLIVVLLANFLKYPFFEYGHRYTAATKETLLDGYLKLGRGYLLTYIVLNIITAIGSIAAVSFVTAALAQNMFGTGIPIVAWTGMIMAVCVAIYMIGHYHFLDIGIKTLMFLLFVATVVAFVAAWSHGPVAPEGFISSSPWTLTALPFLIALMGWMPGPIEMSSWQSLWMEAKHRDTDDYPSMEEAKLDFNVGYIMTVVLAVMFLGLGAFVMHGSSEAFSNKAAGFAAQVVSLYTNVIGEWAWPVISAAAFTAMFSTTLTLMDAYPRALSVSIKLAFPKLKFSIAAIRWFWTFLAAAIALVILSAYVSSLTTLVDIVTIVAFLAGPFFGYMNYRLVRSEHMPDEHKPRALMSALSIAGLVYLVGFGALFIAFRLGAFGA